MKNLLFIANLPHSGSTLLDKLLNFHDEITSIVDYSKNFKISVMISKYTLFDDQIKSR